MNKEIIYNFVLGFLMLSISLIILKVGFNIYGGDANILWTMGFLSYLGIKGIAEAFRPFINKRKAK